MKLGPLSVTFHRTVRVAEGRTPANLPPSLGHIRAFKVTDYRARCPGLWEEGGVFIGLHDTEALWLSFSTPRPVAVMVGAGSINAVNGKTLGTKLEAGGYLVTPPQPWLDGWKATDGTVYQFVATPYEKGKGKTVAEQLIGEQSKTGGIGLALFDSKEPLTPKMVPHEGIGGAYGDIKYGAMPMASPGGVIGMSASTGQHVNSSKMFRSASMDSAFTEMGLGKGGKIVQKIYEDPYGLDVWKELPSQTMAVYLVHAELLAEITGQPIQKPVAQEGYGGHYFGLQDEAEGDVPGTDAFTGLKSVFAETPEPAETTEKK